MNRKRLYYLTILLPAFSNTFFSPAVAGKRYARLIFVTRPIVGGKGRLARLAQ